MKLIENECSEALTRLLRPYYAKVDVQNVYHSINEGHSIKDDSNLLTLLIMEYFGNPPLKFEELKEREIYYHIYYGWISIRSISDYECILINTLNSDGYKQIEFEEDCFYRKELRG